MLTVYGDRVVGVLKATSEKPAAFDPLDQRALEQSAGLIAAALGREIGRERAAADQAALRSELDHADSQLQTGQ